MSKSSLDLSKPLNTFKTMVEMEILYSVQHVVTQTKLAI